MREFDITPKGVKQQHYLDLFEKSGEALNVPADAHRGVSATWYLKQERSSMRVIMPRYHFLVEANAEASDGLEHHQSSDEQIPELGMVNPAFAAEAGSLLAHEMTHSWNGKFRRPAGLATSDYQQPMIGDLLWVYEGLTSYWGEVLATRSGLETLAQVKDRLALNQAEMDARSGRGWRNLQEVSRSAQLLYTSSQQWNNLRRGSGLLSRRPPALVAG